MTPTTREARPDGRPVFYAGRFSGEVSGADLPEGSVVLGDRDVLPSNLAAVARGATAIVVLDLFSFPFEVLGEEGWDVPLVVALPDGFDAGFLDAVFGEPVFGRLGFFDRVLARDDAVWADLSGAYGWAETQRLRPEAGDTGGVAAGLAAPAAGGGAARAEKAAYRAQAAALGPRFAAARGDRAGDVPFSVLEVGAGDGRWAGSFDPSPTHLEAVDRPVAGGALPFEDEGFDLVFAVDASRGLAVPEKHALVSEMWRVARPGGRLLFLEDFVAGESLGNRGEHVIGVLDFNEVVIGATAGRVTLEHVRSVRYPGEDLFRAGVVEYAKLGVPQKW